ncbi:FtsK/SpoIIIE family DNA translocase [Paenisporosarcina cavernae]|uniref:DNA translocase FtsK n=1 Tax=Paenisporosarcina cavernae TaxID=2320858 RepID=A0A385YUY3_9BACL|nr:DNA translocase FtsK [Paenisporosarcina cavernae]AYC29293.1 DNA translocase FtsK [Paenisporosarcina cavernae]
MAKKKKSKKTSKRKDQKKLHPLVFEIIGLALIGLAIITFFEYGWVGEILTSISMFLFGNWYIAVPLMVITYALLMMVKRKRPEWKSRVLIGLICILFSFTVFSHLYLFEDLVASRSLQSNSVLKETWNLLIVQDGIINRTNYLGGGMIGALLFASLHVLFASTGALIVAWLLLFTGAILLTGKALVPIVAEEIPKWNEKFAEWMKRKSSKTKPTKRRSKQPKILETEKKLPTETIEVTEQASTLVEDAPIISAFTEKVLKKEAPAKIEETEEIPEVNFLQDSVEETDQQSYVLPSASLLKEPPPSDQSGEYSAIQQNAKKLEATFQSFGVKAKVTQVHLGPAVTKYEVLPDTGVKVSKIVSLSDDLALALAARDIRMEAPIPGKSAIGIEVPNNEVAIVSLREVLEAKENNRPDAKLMIGLGRDITGQAVLSELNKMPHLLVAGSTGSGKSVCINGIIVSILMRAKPHEVKLMMIDPKMVELNVYNGIPHLLAPVVTDPRKASQALKKVVSEMERRYDLFSHTGTRNLEGYNEHVRLFNEENEEKHPQLPYIVVIVDELADLMMVASNEVEDSITRLAQMARAAGIHLIIATQRPSVDVITGVIKANIPSRIAFAVSSSIDSRTILDMGGAEKLLGRGDMLFLSAGASKPVRVQGAFLSDQEVENVVDYTISQQKANYQEEMIPDEVVDAPVQEDLDEYYDDAVQLVTDMQTASVSLIQRRFRVGYSRAARLIDQMELNGVVGPYEGSKPRQVLISKSYEDN